MKKEKLKFKIVKLLIQDEKSRNQPKSIVEQAQELYDWILNNLDV